MSGDDGDHDDNFDHDDFSDAPSFADDADLSDAPPDDDHIGEEPGDGIDDAPSDADHPGAPPDDAGPPLPQPRPHTDPPATHPPERHAPYAPRAAAATAVDPFDTPFDELERLPPGELRELAAAARLTLYLEIVGELAERLSPQTLEDMTPNDILWHDARALSGRTTQRRARLDVLDALARSGTAARPAVATTGSQPHHQPRHKRRRR